MGSTRRLPSLTPGLGRPRAQDCRPDRHRCLPGPGCVSDGPKDVCLPVFGAATSVIRSRDHGFCLSSGLSSLDGHVAMWGVPHVRKLGSTRRETEAFSLRASKDLNSDNHMDLYVVLPCWTFRGTPTPAAP